MRACGISTQLQKLCRNMPVTCSSLEGCISACCIAPQAQDSVSAQQPTARVACSCRQHTPLRLTFHQSRLRCLPAPCSSWPPGSRSCRSLSGTSCRAQQQVPFSNNNYQAWLGDSGVEYVTSRHTCCLPSAAPSSQLSPQGQPQLALAQQWVCLPRCPSLTPEGSGCEHGGAKHTAYLVPNFPAGSLTLAMEPASTAMGLASP